jgi:hypothetical protein
MRLLVAVALFLPVCAVSQDAPKKGPAIPEPKNLKILKGQTGEQVIETMRSFRTALGVQCVYCHVAGTGGPPDFASDANPKKDVAREMLTMAREINAKFPQDGKRRVSCYTCHRGAAIPLTAPPDAAAPAK